MGLSNFDYERFFTEDLGSAWKLCNSSLPSQEYHLQKLGNSAPDPSTLYGMILESTGTIPVFYLEGEIQIANIRPAQVERNRQNGRENRADRYLLMLGVDSAEYQQLVMNVDDIVRYWQEQKDEIKLMVQNRKQDFSEVSFVRNVASPRALRPDSKVRCFLPLPTEQTLMRKPPNFHWHSKTPICNEDHDPVDVLGTNVIDEMAKVYFQINQNYFGGKIRLIPELVGIMVDMTAGETPCKKARKSILF